MKGRQRASLPSMGTSVRETATLGGVRPPGPRGRGWRRRRAPGARALRPSRFFTTPGGAPQERCPPRSRSRLQLHGSPSPRARSPHLPLGPVGAAPASVPARRARLCLRRPRGLDGDGAFRKVPARSPVAAPAVVALPHLAGLPTRPARGRPRCGASRAPEARGRPPARSGSPTAGVVQRCSSTLTSCASRAAIRRRRRSELYTTAGRCPFRSLPRTGEVRTGRARTGAAVDPVHRSPRSRLGVRRRRLRRRHPRRRVGQV